MNVFFIHTVNGLADMFKKLCEEYIPDAQITQISDESLIQRILAAGGLTPSIFRSVCQHIISAEQANANIIQLTCSSISPCVDIARNLVSVPVLKIDEPMIETAVKEYATIGVIATAPTTLKPTSELVLTKAAQINCNPQVESVLCEGALQAFLSGDLEKHDTIVQEHLKTLMKKVDVILLAQASMARIGDTIDEKEKAVPILSSPRPAMQKLNAIIKEMTR